MKKRIAFVTNNMVVGGVERALVALLNAIDYSRYEVVLWTRQMGGELDKEINPNVEVRVWNTPGSRKQLTDTLKHGDLNGFAKGVWYRYKMRTTGCDWVFNEYYETKAQEICDDRIYDAVIAYQGLYSCVIATALYRLNSPKKIAWIHGEHSFTNEQRRFFSKEYCKFTKVFCVSESIKNTFLRSFPKVTDKTDVFYNLVECDKIQKLAQEKTD